MCAVANSTVMLSKKFMVRLRSVNSLMLFFFYSLDGQGFHATVCTHIITQCLNPNLVGPTECPLKQYFQWDKSKIDRMDHV